MSTSEQNQLGHCRAVRRFRMQRWFFFILSGFVFAAYGQSPVQVQPAAKSPFPFVEGQLLIKPRGGANAGALAAQHAAVGAQVLRAFPAFGNVQLLQLPSGITVEAAIENYRRSGAVEYAEPNYIVHIAESQMLPNDLPASLWSLHNTGQDGGVADADIDAPEAWSYATSSGPVIVGVVDTGIDYTHPDLAANMWANSDEIAGDSIDNDGNGYVDDIHGINAITSSGNPLDDHYHGTHVAGTIGAVGNNGIGVAGVAWNAKLMALKFLNSSGSGNVGDAIRCLDYARAKGARILNNSWGGGGFSQALYDAIAATRAAGIVFVAAAGNSSSDNDATPFYPASYNIDNIVSVAATDRTDAFAYFSNYGYSTVEIGAPGVSIYSTMPGNQYDVLSGTSMASPHVAGALALLRAYRPELNTPSALIDQLLGTVDRISSLTPRTRTGGRLNLFKALTATPAPTAHLTLSQNMVPPGGTVTFSDASFGDITSRTLDFGDGSAPTPVTNTTHQYQALGSYVATLTVTGPGGTHSRTQPVFVQTNYNVQTTAFAWVNTTAFTTVPLGDDSASSAIALPFTFNLYGQNYSTAFIGSNGLLTLGSNSGTWLYNNTNLPSAAVPNAAIYAYWDDLNPAAGGAVKYGQAPDGSFVVSWEAVPHFNALNTRITSQAILQQDGSIRLQYLDVQPGSTSGGGVSATIGVENGVGQVASVYDFNGSTPITNGLAIRFSMGTSAPAAPAPPASLVATATSTTSIALSWADNANNEDSYRVERLINGNFASIGSIPANSTTFGDSGLSASTLYTYRVFAINSGGDSNPSNEASATTLDEPPTAPTFVVSPTSWNAPGVGGTQTVNIAATPANAPWNASSGASWLTVTPASGVGTGTVTLTAAPTTSAFPRSATATIAGQTVNVTQAAGVPTFALSPTNWNAAAGGGTQSVTVTSSLSDAPWTAVSNASWLTASPGSGAGNGTVTLTAASTTSTSTRTTTVTIGNQTVTVTQAAGSVTLNITKWNVPQNGGNQVVTVTVSPATVNWTATSSQSWVTVNPSSGVGSGSVTLSATANTLRKPRNAQVTIGGKNITVSQK